MKYKFFLSVAAIFSLSFLMHHNAFSQNTARTITVSGSSEYNLSPNEIIIKISFQEYFTDGDAAKNKVTIEDLEQEVIKALNSAGIEKEKITMGAAKIVRPYVKGVYQQRRLNKSLLVCIETTQDYIKLTRELENNGLFNEIVTDFAIVEYRHTEKEEYLTKSRSEAYDDAFEKATLILSKSDQKLGKAIKIEELNNRLSPTSNNLYTLDAAQESTSGFKPIVIAYELKVTFEIL